ncbi:plasmid stabilization protein [Ramlibacter sp.]|uniref:plasmid stabilization protein n=1 Tax=Ramlibacter sp. TaxID=1917967 RepID=UPI002FCA35A6
MPRGSSPKRERQYEHIKESYEQRGQGRRAEEIAARTVNKERAETGETKASRKSPSRAGGQAGKAGKPAAARGGGPTREQLYEEARRKGVEGRSKMSKAQLKKAVAR